MSGYWLLVYWLLVIGSQNPDHHGFVKKYNLNSAVSSLMLSVA